MKKLFLFFSLCMAMTVLAETTVDVQDRKMVVERDGVSYVLTPNGEDASYFWCSVSPDGQRLVYRTAFQGAFVCDLDGQNVVSLGILNAPKWADNDHIMGMIERYGDNDEIISVRYLKYDLRTMKVVELTSVEQQVFIGAEEMRLQAMRVAAQKRAAAKRVAEAKGEATTTGLSGLKIYLNPGHGGYDANDRSCWTVNVPETWSNPKGYWESKSNLMKGLILKELLEEAGATVYISRTENTSGERDIEYYPGASPEKLDSLMKGGDRLLSAIAEEANANKVDHFLSVHSNALNSQTNYLLLLYHGETDKPTVATSDLMAANSGAIQIENPLTVWTSPKPLLRGDLTFYGDDMGLGVLRPLTVPGFLSEGSFHDYVPETHRLMNYDFCKFEALRLLKHFYTYYKRDMPQTGTISGWVKSSNELVDVLGQKKFTYVAGSNDQWLALNGAEVILEQGGEVIAKDTTDEWYNGIFAFYNVAPGDYKVTINKDHYKTISDSVTVVATEIAGMTLFMKNIHMNPADYPEPETDAQALENYDFVSAGDTTDCAANTTRVLYRNGYIYTLEDGAVYRCATDFTSREAVVMPQGVTLSDIAFASDDYLFGKVAGSSEIYMWDDEVLNPEVSTYTATATDNYIVISGPHWNPTILSSASYIALGMDSKAFACTGSSFFRYAKHAYRVDMNKGQFQLFDITDTEKAASVLCPETPVAGDGYIGTAAWTEGYVIHVVVAAAGGKMLHFKTLTTPVKNIYAGECKFENEQFTFRLNEDATSVVLTIEREDQDPVSQELGAMKKGVHTIASPFTQYDYVAYSITATARPVGFVTKVSDDSPVFQFYAPRGVAVDRNPKSPFFGRIYATESLGGECTEAWYDTPERFRTVSQGVYVIGSDFTDVTAQGDSAYNGHINWGTNASGSYQFPLTRPSVGPDGKVYVPSSTMEACGLYIMDPAQPTDTFTAVFGGKHQTSCAQVRKGKNVVCNEVMNCVVLGTGEETVLYTYDRDVSAGVSGCIWQYNLGTTALPWEAKPSKVFFENATQDNHMQNSNGQIAYDQQGGFFLSQYRYNSSWAVPGLIHVNAKGVLDFNISNNGVDAIQQGGMAVNTDGSLLALGTELGHVYVYDVTYDAAGAPTLTKKFDIAWAEGKGNTYGCDFDAAGNLYIVSNSNERLMVYSLPKLNNSYTTRIECQHKGTGVENVWDTNQTTKVQKVMVNGELLIIRNGQTYDAAGRMK